MIYGTNSIVHINDIFQQHMYVEKYPEAYYTTNSQFIAPLSSLDTATFFASIVKYYRLKDGIFFDVINIAFDRHFCFIYMSSLDITLSMQFT